MNPGDEDGLIAHWIGLFLIPMSVLHRITRGLESRYLPDATNGNEGDSKRFRQVDHS